MKHIITIIAACLLFATASFAQDEKLGSYDFSSIYGFYVEE